VRGLVSIFVAAPFTAEQAWSLRKVFVSSNGACYFVLLLQCDLSDQQCAEHCMRFKLPNCGSYSIDVISVCGSAQGWRRESV